MKKKKSSMKKKGDRHISYGFFAFFLRVHGKMYQTNISKKEKKTVFIYTHHLHIDRQPQKKNEDSQRHIGDNDVDINTIKRVCIFALVLKASVVLWSQLMTYAVLSIFFLLNIDGKFI
jgi:hypothetical protein